MSWKEPADTANVTAYDPVLSARVAPCNASAIAVDAQAEVQPVVRNASDVEGAGNNTISAPANVTRRACMLDARNVPSPRAYTQALLASVSGATETSQAAIVSASGLPPNASVVFGQPPVTTVEAGHLWVHVGGASASVGPIETAATMFSGPMHNATAPFVFAEPRDACRALDNGAAINGSYAVVVRGSCPMVDKARNAQAAGAIALLIVNGEYQDAIHAPADLLAAGTGSSKSEADSVVSLPAGIARAVGDDYLKDRPVHIPCVMLSAHAFYTIERALALARGKQEGASIPVTARLSPSPLSTSLWDSIAAIGKAGHVWEGDAFQQQRELLRLLRLHHPSSGTGGAERYALLRHYAGRAGLLDDLTSLEQEIVWEGGKDIAAHAGMGRGQHRGSHLLDHTALASFHLTANLPISRMAREQGDWLMQCRSDSTNTYTVRLGLGHGSGSGSSLAGLSSPTRRIAEAIAQQACIEKLALINAAHLGSLLAVLRHELDTEDWGRTTNTLFRPWRIGGEEASRMAGRYIEVSTLYENEMPTSDAMTVGQWVDAALQ